MPSIIAMENEHVRPRKDCEIDTGKPIEFTQVEISSHHFQVHDTWRFRKRPRRILEDQKLRAKRSTNRRHDIGEAVAAVHLTRGQRSELSG